MCVCMSGGAISLRSTNFGKLSFYGNSEETIWSQYIVELDYDVPAVDQRAVANDLVNFCASI